MSDIEKIQLFEQKKIRTAWDEEKQEWFFSIVDVCGVLTGQPDYDLAKNYWKVLKHRLIKEGNESVTKCNQLKLPSPKDGKRYATDVADMALMFRIIESIPSKKAEPIKVWMASAPICVTVDNYSECPMARNLSRSSSIRFRRSSNGRSLPKMKWRCISA